MSFLNFVIFTLAGVFSLSLVFYMICGKLTDPKFELIKNKFSEQFGYTPYSMRVGAMGGIPFWTYRDIILIYAIFFQGATATQKMLSKDEILFFKNLNKQDIYWLYFKYIPPIIGLVCAIALGIILLLNEI